MLLIYSAYHFPRAHSPPIMFSRGKCNAPQQCYSFWPSDWFKVYTFAEVHYKSCFDSLSLYSFGVENQSETLCFTFSTNSIGVGATFVSTEQGEISCSNSGSELSIQSLHMLNRHCTMGQHKKLASYLGARWGADWPSRPS